MPPPGGGVSARQGRAAYRPRAVPVALAPEDAERLVAGYAAWERVTSSEEMGCPRVAAIRSWKPKTRYGSRIHHVANFQKCVRTKPLHQPLSLCLTERARKGHSTSRMWGIMSVVRAAEDSELVPKIGSAIHC